MDDRHPEIDDRFVGDWIAFGLNQLEAFLANHARFDAWCAGRQADTPQAA
jgi:hypothetical protein